MRSTIRHSIGSLSTFYNPPLTIDLILTDERSASSLVKFETHYLSPVFDEEAQYFHVPFTAEFEFEHVLRKERKSFHAPFLYDKANWNNFQIDIEGENSRLINCDEKLGPRAKERHKKKQQLSTGKKVSVLKKIGTIGVVCTGKTETNLLRKHTNSRSHKLMI